MPNFGKLLKEKQPFLMSTYGLLVAELVVTFAIVYAFRNSPAAKKITRQSILLYFALTFGIILILSFVPMPDWMKLVLFTVFAVVIGGMLHSITVVVPRELVDNALKGTIVIFVCMSVFALLLASMGVDLSWMQLVLFAALIGLLVASLLAMFFSPKSSKIHKALLVFGLVVFSIFVMVYTNMILQPGYKGSYIDAAIGFYLDFVNIFTRLLALDGSA